MWFLNPSTKDQNNPSTTENFASSPPSLQSMNAISLNDAHADADDALRPIQHQAPRCATLVITESERDLYLAAVDRLNQAPALQPFRIGEQPPPLLSPVPELRPLSFPQVEYPASLSSQDPDKPRRHALLTLSGDSGLRFTAFDIHALAAARAALMAWPLGIYAFSDETAVPLKLPSRDAETKRVDIWRVELPGKAWKLKGSQELESIRLLLVLFTVLAQHGWRMECTLNAATSKVDWYNLVFATGDASPPPLFFAITLPLPDRLSLISPPPAATGQIVKAVREAIFSQADGTKPEHESVKDEAWVHPGVYSFWLAGLRRWQGGVKRGAVAKLQPPLMVAIMDAVSELGFTYVGPIAINPKNTGRDVLVFSSTAESGLGAVDGYTELPRPTSETPVPLIKRDARGRWTPDIPFGAQARAWTPHSGQATTLVNPSPTRRPSQTPTVSPAVSLAASAPVPSAHTASPLPRNLAPRTDGSRTNTSDSDASDDSTECIPGTITPSLTATPPSPHRPRRSLDALGWEYPPHTPPDASLAWGAQRNRLSPAGRPKHGRSKSHVPTRTSDSPIGFGLGLPSRSPTPITGSDTDPPSPRTPILVPGEYLSHHTGIRLPVRPDVHAAAAASFLAAAQGKGVHVARVVQVRQRPVGVPRVVGEVQSLQGSVGSAATGSAVTAGTAAVTEGTQGSGRSRPGGWSGTWRTEESTDRRRESRGSVGSRGSRMSRINVLAGGLDS